MIRMYFTQIVYGVHLLWKKSAYAVHVLYIMCTYMGVGGRREGEGGGGKG